MERITDYRGPGADDYADVLALNSAFLEATSALKRPQRGRLAAAPFLLFSLRENDLAWWELALLEQRQGDLMSPSEHSNVELRRIQNAALSFLWQLSRQNPYAARIISGASIRWCEKITELPLVTLLNRIGAREDLMISRIESADNSGERLLGPGISSRPQIRRSSQLAVLQGLLTRTGLNEYARLSTAACSMPRHLRVLPKKA